MIKQQRVGRNLYTYIICLKYAYNMLMPQHISVEQALLQLSVNFHSETFKFLSLAEISNMLVYMVIAGFP